MIENSHEPTLNIVRGNDAYLSIRLTLKEDELQAGQPSSSSVDFVPSGSSPVMVILRSGNKKWSFTANVDGCIAGVALPDTLPSGLYSLEVMCRDDNDNDYRFMRQKAVRIVESTAEAYLDPGVEFDARCRYMTAEFVRGVDMSNYYTKEEIDNKGFLTQHQDISGKADLEKNTRRLSYMQASAVVLASINGDTSSVSSFSEGDIFFSEDTEKLYMVSGNEATVIGEPDDKLVYFDLGTNKHYRYDFSQGFVEIGGGSGGGGAQVQSDWKESDTSSPAYIKNKPTIPTAINGKSAYQIALDNGFEGSEADWLASLHGQDGQDGQDGQNGQDGHDGQDGQNGVDGQDGADGKSAYQSYLDTTTDSPKKTEAQWVASLKGEQGNNGFSVNETSTAIVFTVWQGATIQEKSTKITISA